MVRYCFHCRLAVADGSLVVDEVRLQHMASCPMRISRNKENVRGPPLPHPHSLILVSRTSPFFYLAFFSSLGWQSSAAGQSPLSGGKRRRQASAGSASSNDNDAADEAVRANKRLRGGDNDSDEINVISLGSSDDDDGNEADNDDGNDDGSAADNNDGNDDDDDDATETAAAAAPRLITRSLESLMVACNRGVAYGRQARELERLHAHTRVLEESAGKAHAGVKELTDSREWKDAEYAVAECDKAWTAWQAQLSGDDAARLAAAARGLALRMEACERLADRLAERRATAAEAEQCLAVHHGRVAALSEALGRERADLAAIGVDVTASADQLETATYTPGVARPPTCSLCGKSDASPVVSVQECQATHDLCLGCLGPLDSLTPACPVCRPRAQASLMTPGAFYSTNPELSHLLLSLTESHETTFTGDD